MHTMGRDSVTVDTMLENSHCSRLQCVFRFQGGVWIISDKSKNGTFVNAKPINGEGLSLVMGDKISFPGEKAYWTLDQATSPKPMLVCQQKRNYMELSSLNVLPNESNPELLISKQGEKWILEKGENAQVIYGGQYIHLSGKDWVFYPNDLIQETITHLYIEEQDKFLHLHFDISLNEENIRVVSNYKNKKTDFGYKAHHQLLLVLARYRIYDQERNIPVCEQGWMASDVLLHELGIEGNHLNISIYRLRKAFISTGFTESLIERRQGEIRIGNFDLTLHKGDSIIEYESVVE